MPRSFHAAARPAYPLIALFALAASAGIATADVDTFTFDDSPIGTLLPLTNYAPEISIGTGITANISSIVPNSAGILSGAEFIPLGSPFEQHFLVATDGPITISFSQPITAISFAYIAYNMTLTSAEGSIVQQGIDLNSDLIESYFQTSFANPVSSITLSATSQFNDPVTFAVDNIGVTVPTPGAAALLALGGLTACTRRRRR